MTGNVEVSITVFGGGYRVTDTVCMNVVSKADFLQQVRNAANALSASWDFLKWQTGIRSGTFNR